MAHESRARLLARDAVRVESDQQRDAARALEMLHVQLISAVIDPYSWKWVLMVLQHAVQLFVAAARSESAAVVHAAEGDLEYDVSREGAEGSPRDLLDRARALAGEAWTEDLERDLVRLTESRRVLVDGFPRRWSMDISDLPRVARSGLCWIEIVGWTSAGIPWRKKRVEDLARVKLMASIKVLEALERQYRGE